MYYVSRKLGAKPYHTPTVPNSHSQLTKKGDLADECEGYRRLVGKLNYLMVIS